MVRYRWSCQVIYGRWGEFYELQERKVALASERGWVIPRFWVATAGNLNDFFLERDYETIEQLASELSAREADYEFMKLMRESYKMVVQGSVRIELFQTAAEAR
ncbi:MAG TPA: hypothetical protein VHJ34_07200 [Actinomycetota bacterium]|nr:hypothetical protein [Actinomycetota bacterium]